MRQPPSDQPPNTPDNGSELDLKTDGAERDDVHDQVDDGDASVCARAALPEDCEFVGHYPSVEEYLRSMLEPEISRGCAWILDCLDWDAVIARFEEDGASYVCEAGQVFRIGGA